jgi:hypothetical protein
MSWTRSAIFQEWVKNPLLNGPGGTPPTGPYTGYLTDTVKAALFGGNTPSQTASVATTGYNSAASQWLTSSEKTSGTDWLAGGRALTSKTSTASGGAVILDAADLMSVAVSTISGAEGFLVYDDTITGGTVQDQGMCFTWFGGSQSVVSGTFSVVFAPTGVMAFSL